MRRGRSSSPTLRTTFCRKRSSTFMSSSPLRPPQPVDEQLRTRHQGRQGLASRAGATAAGTRPSRRRRVRSAYRRIPALCDEGHEDYDPRFSLTWGCLWDWLLFEFGIVSFALYVRPSAPSKERSVKVAAPAPTARPSRPSTVLKQNSGVNVASCLLAAPATAAAPAAAAPRARAAEGSERRSSQMRRRSTISASIQGSTRRAAASVSARSGGRRRCSRVGRGRGTS